MSAHQDDTATFDWLHWWMTGAHLWILGGLFLDGWHHINDPGLESFFTPWHGVLYSGIGVAMAIMGERVRRRRRQGLRGLAAVPADYRLAAVGGVVFVAGGFIDMVWHEVLGIEVGVEALLSPPHLLLCVAGVLVFTGPLRVAWRELPRQPGWRDVGPALLSLMGIAALLGFFTQYVSPFTHLYPTLTPSPGHSADLLHATGVAGIIVTTAILTGATLLAVARWRLPLGAVTLIVGGSALLMTTQRGTYGLLPAVLLSGLAADVAVRRFAPAERGAWALRLAGAAIPVLLFIGYFVTLAVAGTLQWSVHLVTGSIVVAGATGALLAALLLAPGPAPAAPAAPPGTAPREHPTDEIVGSLR
jgi:hypothetical protein